jgi:hypothetical protein
VGEKSAGIKGVERERGRREEKREKGKGKREKG